MTGAQPTAEGMGAPEQGPHMIKNTVPKNGREKTRKKQKGVKKRTRKNKNKNKKYNLKKKEQRIIFQDDFLFCF